MDPRYPIGKYEPQAFSPELKNSLLLDIKSLPDNLEMALHNLDEYQLDTPYREGGWTVKQVVHHIADSHMNAYIRFKLGLTEDSPLIKPYDEKEWAKLPDVINVPVNVSATLLHALHQRWYATIKDLTEDQFARTVVHPEGNRKMDLWFMLGLYAWHGKHHVAHITTLRKNKGW
jgi:uncharacterized damage-inducible protein DinB